MELAQELPKQIINKSNPMSTGGFSMVSVAPVPSHTFDTRQLNKIKEQQDTLKKAWVGVSVETIGKPGGSWKKTYETSYVKRLEKKTIEFLEKLRINKDSRGSLITFSAVKDLSNRENFSISITESVTNEMSFRMHKSEARIVRAILEKAGFVQTSGHDWSILWMGTIPKPYIFEKLTEYQIVNHHPNTYEITRKDLLCVSLNKMIDKFGIDHFNFCPETFILPDELSKFYFAFNALKKSLWIVKPSASSQGRGIYLVDNLSEIPIDEQFIISRYLSSPFLIDGLKFDLRLYVLVSSFDPLRIYLYEEGLVRFASEPYHRGSKNNRFIHLTNYSLNKRSDNFVKNEVCRYIGFQSR